MPGHGSATATRTPYITPHGLKALQAEQAELWKRRHKVVAALSAAAAEGDRSENAEYIYRKKQLREMDRRIRYLQRRLPELRIVDALPPNLEQVFFGAWVTLEDESGNELAVRIVGADEFDAKKRWISIDAPMSRALLKKTVDDKVTVQTPAGCVTYSVTAVRYAND